MDQQQQKKVNVYKDYLSDRKTIFTIIAMSLAFIVVIVLSFGTTFYFKDFRSDDFWTDLAISFILCVYCLCFGIPEAKNLYQKKVNGRFVLARQKFMTIRETVEPKDVIFNQWLEKYYQLNKRQYFESILSLAGINNPLVLDLDKNELDNLLHPYKKCWKDTEFEGREDTYFRTLNKEQVEVIKKIFDGKITVEKIPDDFFKTLNNKIITSEYVGEQNRHANEIKEYAGLIIFRVIMVFLLAFVFASFGVNVAEDRTASEILQTIITTVSRIWTMISSFTYGFGIGKTMVINEATTLEFKTRVNTLFNNDKDFKGYDDKEIAEKEYNEYIGGKENGETIEQ